MVSLESINKIGIRIMGCICLGLVVLFVLSCSILACPTTDGDPFNDQCTMIIISLLFADVVFCTILYILFICFLKYQKYQERLHRTRLAIVPTYAETTIDPTEVDYTSDLLDNDRLQIVYDTNNHSFVD